jgi:hypothetical protein
MTCIMMNEKWANDYTNFKNNTALGCKGSSMWRPQDTQYICPK